MVMWGIEGERERKGNFCIGDLLPWQEVSHGEKVSKQLQISRTSLDQTARRLSCRHTEVEILICFGADDSVSSSTT